ncbi:hypothetical protein CEXT_247331, partial [Caerostris extrusa]
DKPLYTLKDLRTVVLQKGLNELGYLYRGVFLN